MTNLVTIPKDHLNSILAMFPLARLSDIFLKNFNEAQDERINQNLVASFQLRDIKACYHLLEAKVPGLEIMIPIKFHESEKTITIEWVGENDPYGLTDMRVDAVTSIDTDHQTGFCFRVEILSSWKQRRVLSEVEAKQFSQLVPKQIFDEAIRSFCSFVDPVPACPCSYDYEPARFDDPCRICAGKKRLPWEQLRAKWVPHKWFEIIAMNPSEDWE